MVDCVKDQTLKAWLEDGEGIGALRQHVGLIFALGESSNVNLVFLRNHNCGIVSTRTVVRCGEDCNDWRKFVGAIPSMELVPCLLLLVGADHRSKPLILQ